ncbi:uncharacterized protein BO87DRAFT_375344 [Aspergillus neoniger CBS 115656]|uniref:Uncharacterized protein n=1 Tax=Aspergillus neoniger (strain CBS 115656) TaxID=1448310 RepID=A0A318YM90_ASPNB|nr:hypothetical protein BO87DRAFT_375344 [Aspergillus neoniger CBS 115656]PYH35725.1 hypothetical protein BO87DRAFT_375344 [Aspergillus neoniger CBS 115656]
MSVDFIVQQSRLLSNTNIKPWLVDTGKGNGKKAFGGQSLPEQAFLTRRPRTFGS